MPSWLPSVPCFALCLPAHKWVATLNVGYGGAHASYYHRANEQVRVPLCPAWCPPRGALLLTLPPPPRRCRSGWSWRPTLGCRTQPSPSATNSACPKATSSSEVSRESLAVPSASPGTAGGCSLPAPFLAGLLDSNWSVGGVLEKRLPPLPVSLALGAFLNHWRNRFHCGFSVTVG